MPCDPSRVRDGMDHLGGFPSVCPHHAVFLPGLLPRLPQPYLNNCSFPSTAFSSMVAVMAKLVKGSPFLKVEPF